MNVDGSMSANRADGPALEDRVQRGDEREGRRHHLVARTDTQCLQRGDERDRAVRHRHRVGVTAQRRETGFEARDHRALRDMSRAQDVEDELLRLLVDVYGVKRDHVVSTWTRPGRHQVVVSDLRAGSGCRRRCRRAGR